MSGQRKPPFCHYFNNNKACPYETNCRFQHKESKPCKDGANCTRHKCQFRHQPTSGGNHFLSNQNYYWNGGGTDRSPTTVQASPTQMMSINAVPLSLTPNCETIGNNPPFPMVSYHVPPIMNNQSATISSNNIQQSNETQPFPHHFPPPPFPFPFLPTSHVPNSLHHNVLQQTQVGA